MRYGNTVQLAVSASDANGSWNATPHIELVPFDNGTTESNTCYPWGSCTYQRSHT